MRCCERRYRRSRDLTNCLAWVSQLRPLHRLYRHKGRVLGTPCCPKRKEPKMPMVFHLGLHRTFSSLSGFTDNDFLNMMTTKIERLRLFVHQRLVLCHRNSLPLNSSSMAFSVRLSAFRTRSPVNWIHFLRSLLL